MKNSYDSGAPVIDEEKVGKEFRDDLSRET